MAYIINPAFSDMERYFLNFILGHDFPERDAVVMLLNGLKAEEISRDVSPYFWMVRFRPGGANPGFGPMRPYIEIEVLHTDGSAPTEFTIYERNGIAFELEIYNADPSAMELDRLLDGTAVVRSQDPEEASAVMESLKLRYNFLSKQEHSNGNPAAQS